MKDMGWGGVSLSFSKPQRKLNCDRNKKQPLKIELRYIDQYQTQERKIQVKEDKKGDGAKSDELDDEAGRGFLQAGRTTPQVPYGRLLVVYMPSTGAPGGPTRSRSANRLSGEKLHSAQIRRDDCPFPASCQRSRWAAPGDVLSSPSPDRVWWPDRYVGHVEGSKKP